LRAGCILALAALAASGAAAQSLRVEVANPAPFPRRGEIAAVSIDELKKRMPSFDPARAVVVEASSDRRIMSQLAGSEMLFQADCEANASSAYSIRQELPDSGTLVDSRHVMPRGDYAWENDRIAFRMYGSSAAGDVRNGIDVWTKRVRSLIVAKWYRESEGSPPGKDTYHTDRGEGADFFSVGRSLGAGGSGLWLRDTLFQPRMFSSWKTIANGPLRVCFELTYDSIRAGGSIFSEVRRISLDAGDNLNAITVTYAGPGAGSPIGFAAGLVKRKDTRVSRNEAEHWMSLWGQTVADTSAGHLGTGIVFPAEAFAGFAEDSTQHLVLGKGAAGKAHTYYSGAGWTRSGDYASESDWKDYLSRFAARLRMPLRVTVAGD
jgi:pectinesterase